MKEIDELILPGDLYYTKDHEWARKEGKTIKIGISDYAQDQLGEIVFVELPEVGDTFSKGDEFGSVESVKAVSEIYIPVSGEIVEVNEELEDSPELVNSDAFGGGWLFKIKMADAGELDALLDAEGYANSIDED